MLKKYITAHMPHLSHSVSSSFSEAESAVFSGIIWRANLSIITAQATCNTNEKSEGM